MRSVLADPEAVGYESMREARTGSVGPRFGVILRKVWGGSRTSAGARA
jgi:hypothetical protein